MDFLCDVVIYPGAQTTLEQALALVDGTPHYDVLSSVLNRLGNVYYNQGDWERAMQAVERALAIREELGDILVSPALRTI